MQLAPHPRRSAAAQHLADRAGITAAQASAIIAECHAELLAVIRDSAAAAGATDTGAEDQHFDEEGYTAAGMYYTPAGVAEAIDPSCGSGAFPIQALVDNGVLVCGPQGDECRHEEKSVAPPAEPVTRGRVLMALLFAALCAVLVILAVRGGR